MLLAQTKQNQEGKREDQSPTFHYLAEDDGEGQASGSLNDTQEERTWKKATVVVDSGAAENVMPQGHFLNVGLFVFFEHTNGLRCMACGASQ